MVRALDGDSTMTRARPVPPALPPAPLLAATMLPALQSLTGRALRTHSLTGHPAIAVTGGSPRVSILAVDCPPTPPSPTWTPWCPLDDLGGRFGSGWFKSSQVSSTRGCPTVVPTGAHTGPFTDRAVSPSGARPRLDRHSVRGRPDQLGEPD